MGSEGSFSGKRVPIYESAAPKSRGGYSIWVSNEGNLTLRQLPIGGV